MRGARLESSSPGGARAGAGWAFVCKAQGAGWVQGGAKDVNGEGCW